MKVCQYEVFYLSVLTIIITIESGDSDNNDNNKAIIKRLWLVGLYGLNPGSKHVHYTCLRHTLLLQHGVMCSIYSVLL